MSQPSQPSSQRRRLAALMFTDIVGYSTLSSSNESLAMELLEEHRAILRRIFPTYGGNENKTIGDAFFVEFGSAVEAVQCAMEIQTVLFERNSFSPPERRIQIRIGLHLGDIIAFEGDSYGDGVNIAARIEQMANPGGVCITQQVADQILRKAEFRLKKIGKVELKNMGSPTVIYRIVFPWEQVGKNWQGALLKSIFRFLHQFRPLAVASPTEAFTTLLMGLQLAGVLAVFGFAMSNLYSSFQKPCAGRPCGPDATVRVPASEGGEAPRRVPLREGWTFALAQPDGKPPGQWKRFEVDNPGRHADEIQGEYWMKNEFLAHEEFKHPAIVLGLVADSYRAYLNGNFIGGSDYYTYLEYLTTDASKLRRDGMNTLLIHANTRKSPFPGILRLQGVGMFLGEFTDVYHVVLHDRFTYHILRSFYLLFSLLAAGACFLHFLSNREKTKYFYFSLYLFLGSITLTYYNVWVTAAMEYSFHGYMKLFSLVGTSFALCSAWLTIHKRDRMALANNVLGLAVSVVAAIMLLVPEGPIAVYLRDHDRVLMFSMAHAAIWLGWLAVDFIRDAQRRIQDPSLRTASFGYDLVLFTFGVTNLLLAQLSLRLNYDVFYLSPGVRHTLNEIAISYPFFFALFIVLSAFTDYFIKSKKMLGYKRGRDNLILSIIKASEVSSNLEDAISAILEKMSDFIRADRATVYLIQEQEGEKWLSATFIHGPSHARRFLRQTISPHEGIVGYVCQSRSSLLISDLGTDLRFNQYVRSRSAESTYRTASCMLFPLILNSELIGVLTVADKRTGGAFSRGDFALMNAVSKNLALIVRNRQLQEKLDGRDHLKKVGTT